MVFYQILIATSYSDGKMSLREPFSTFKTTFPPYIHYKLRSLCLIVNEIISSLVILTLISRKSLAWKSQASFCSLKHALKTFVSCLKLGLGHSLPLGNNLVLITDCSDHLTSQKLPKFEHYKVATDLVEGL